MSDSARVHVVAAAVLHGTRVFLTKRRASAHQGGLWEFPGGKVEPGETPSEALHRELREELDIEVLQCRPLIQVRHDYEDKQVLLDVWLVDAWRGEPRGAEGQNAAWMQRSELRPAMFPAANGPILTAVSLPATYFITPELASVAYHGLRTLHAALKRGARLVQLRSKQMDSNSLRPLIVQYTALCTSYGASLLVNAHSGLVESTGAHGVHLTARQLHELTARPLGDRHLVGASCHNADDLARAATIGVDFAVLSPVKPTTSHAGAEPLGWEGFCALVRETRIPAYALGGLGEDDLSAAWRAGAQGVAGISKLWGDGDEASVPAA